MQDGMIIASPATGSMLPFIRPQRDQAVFERAEGRLCKHAVALYRRENQSALVMHRILKKTEAGYYFRGDSVRSTQLEFVPEDRIIGVMCGYYRDDTFISCSSLRYKAVSGLWLKLIRPLMCRYRYSNGVFWRGARYLRRMIKRRLGR